MLRNDDLPDDVPPFYQPQGPSHYGGSFADVACGPMPADAVDVKLGGCGVPGV